MTPNFPAGFAVTLYLLYATVRYPQYTTRFLPPFLNSNVMSAETHIQYSPLTVSLRADRRQTEEISALKIPLISC